MYRISGGCRYDKTCEKCENFIPGKINQCIVYPHEQNFNWEGTRMACKFYYKNDDFGQMTIMDYIKK